MRFTETARPKVNLTLEIRGRRADGYHALESLVAFAAAPVDRLTLDISQPRGLTLDGPLATQIVGPNLLDRVVSSADAARPGALRTGAVHLAKSIPVAAGLGGGSADAGALLRALRRANQHPADTIDWFALARTLGADVPVCMLDRPALMWGIGDHLAPVDLPVLRTVVLSPHRPIATDKTARVFRDLAAGDLAADPAPPEIPGPWRDATGLIAHLANRRNDLEAPASRLFPEIEAALAALRREPAIALARMSGAGPSCFGLMLAPPTDAPALTGRLEVRCPGWSCWSTTLGA